MTTEAFTAMLALVGAVIIIAALFSGFIERSNVPQVAVFLALGAMIGPAGLGLLDIQLDSPVLRVVATLSLALVLFTDAVTLSVPEVRRHAVLAMRVLGPGTMLSAVLIAVLVWALLGLHPAAAAIIGAALASTDPVLLRGLLRRPDIPSTARQALRLESGLNDVVLLPVVLVAMAFLGSSGETHAPEWGALILDLFILGPGAGVAVGVLAVATLDLVRRRIGVRRDYESLYSLGVAFAAFAAAEAVHGSGFLAVFAAGLTIAALDVELCDCFLEYGETTAEMALLFTFVLLGSSLIWDGFAVLTWATLIFAGLALLVRPFSFFFALLGTRLEGRARFLISWFGPRGLSTLLLVLVPAFAGTQGSEQMFAISSLVVLLSVAVHGSSIMFLGGVPRQQATAGVTADGSRIADSAEQADGLAPAAAGERPLEGRLMAVERPAALQSGEEQHGGTAGDVGDHPLPVAGDAARLDVAGVDRHDGRTLDGHSAERSPAGAEGPAPAGGQPVSLQEPALHLREEQLPEVTERISVEQMRDLERAGERVFIVDARSERTYELGDTTAKGAVRVDPTRATHEATALRLPNDAWLIVFCA